MYVVDVKKRSFVRCGCLKDISCIVTDVFYFMIVEEMLWLYFFKHFLYVMNVEKTSLVRYECRKDVSCTLWMSKRRLLYVMNVEKTSFVCYECLKLLLYVMRCPLDVFNTLWYFDIDWLMNLIMKTFDLLSTFLSLKNYFNIINLHEKKPQGMFFFIYVISIFLWKWIEIYSQEPVYFLLILKVIFFYDDCLCYVFCVLWVS